MWECLLKIWAWFGNNAGQLQIIIAFIAIFVAYRGYKRALEQTSLGIQSIKMAQDQLKHSFDQSIIQDKNRFFDQKINFLIMLKDDISSTDKAIIEIDNTISDLLVFMTAEANNESGRAAEKLEEFRNFKSQFNDFRNKLVNVKQSMNHNFDSVQNFSIDDSEKLAKLTMLALNQKKILINVLGAVEYDKQKLKLFKSQCK